VRTVNRLGQTTTFQWTGGRLTRVVVPTASGTAPAYDFTYTNGVLTSVSATGARRAHAHGHAGGTSCRTRA
jgi:hypothetical protein